MGKKSKSKCKISKGKLKMKHLEHVQLFFFMYYLQNFKAYKPFTNNMLLTIMH